MNDIREHGRWLDEDTAERLLSGCEDAVWADARAAGLARLLAVAGEPRPGTAEDEWAALQAFGRARAGWPARAERSGSAVLRAAKGSRSGKVLIGGVAAVFALSGAAIASQAGALPHPFQRGGGASHHGPATTTARSAPGKPTGADRDRGGGPAVAGRASAPPPPGTAARVPPGPRTGADPGAKGLCEAYVRQTKQGRPLDAVSQARLEKAAGGAAHVHAYCAGSTAAAVTGTSAPGVPARPGSGTGIGAGTPTPGAPAGAPPVTDTPTTADLATDTLGTGSGDGPTPTTPGAATPPVVPATPDPSAPSGPSAPVTPSGAGTRATTG